MAWKLSVSTQMKLWLTRLFAIVLLAAGAVHADRLDDAIRKPAVFRITTEVVNPDVSPFTATIGGFGNTLIDKGTGFEPVVFRNKLMALEDSPDRVVSDPDAMSYYDTLREGFLDGATVHVYRVANGRFRMVREDRVTKGGSHASGWVRAIGKSQVIAPGTTHFRFRWDDWNRPGARYYFTVCAVDKYGNMSPFAPALEIEAPEKLGKAPVTHNTLSAFKPAGALFSGPKPVSAPRSLRGKLGSDGILTLEWEPANSADLAGYVVYRSDYLPSQHGGYYLQLAGMPALPEQRVRSGDMVIVSKKIYSPSRRRDLSNRVWGAAGEYNKLLPGLIQSFPDEIPGKTWSLVPHAADTPVEDSGETLLKLQVDAGAREALIIYNHGGTGQSWYDVLEQKTYVVEAWLRQEGRGKVQFSLAGFYGSGPQKIKPIAFDAGQGWKKYVAYFTPPVIQDDARPGAMLLEFSGPATFYVDNFRVYHANIPYLDFLPHELEAIKQSGISALRTHGLIKTGIHTYDMEQLTNTGGTINGTQKLNTLPQILRAMRQAGVKPWLQIEYHMSPREWLALVEYLAAPYDPGTDSPVSKPWAHKRYSQGQTRPWTEEFSRIYFELGNETWNGLFAPWTFNTMTDAVTKKVYSPGQIYGLFQEYVRSTMRSSPYWQPAGLDRKLVFVLGGWTANPGYSRDAASVAPSSDFLTIAAYNGGWDQAEDSPRPDAKGLFNTLADVNQSAIPTADLYARELRRLRAGGSTGLRLGTYEAGPGYVLNGLNGARVTEDQARAQEQVMKSLAAGTATLDAFLARAYRGFTVQNFFTFGSGDLWRSHAKWYRGGQAYPSWKLLALFNREAGGDMLRTETLSTPSTELRPFSRRQAVRNAPLAAVYATRKAGRYGIFVISRKVPGYPVSGDDGYTPVDIELPFSAAQSVTLYRMTGAPQANNLLRDEVKIEKVEVPSLKRGRRFSLNSETGADERGLPPASTFLYVFDGVNSAGKENRSPRQ